MYIRPAIQKNNLKESACQGGIIQRPLIRRDRYYKRGCEEHSNLWQYIPHDCKNLQMNQIYSRRLAFLSFQRSQRGFCYVHKTLAFSLSHQPEGIPVIPSSIFLEWHLVGSSSAYEIPFVSSKITVKKEMFN